MRTISTLLTTSLLALVAFVVKSKNHSVRKDHLFKKDFFNRSCLSTGDDYLKKRRGHQYYVIKGKIRTYADIFGVDYKELFSMAVVESGLISSARHPVSPVGAQGLLQLMPRTRIEIFNKLDFDKKDFSIDSHIAASAYYKKWAEGEFEGHSGTRYFSPRELSIISYNYGVSGIKKRIHRSRSPLTNHRYLTSVKLNYILQEPSTKLFKALFLKNKLK